jgi:hypothetical protein
VLALEIKTRSTVTGRDATPFTRARRHLGERLAGGLVVYRGQQVVEIDRAFSRYRIGCSLGWGRTAPRPTLSSLRPVPSSAILQV